MKDDYIKQHFPNVVCNARPTGNQIIVQLRTVKSKTAGGIVLVEDTKQFNNGNTQVGRLVKVGQIAYRNREDGTEWKEGAWATVGDVVVVPRYGGFRVELPIEGSEEKAIFCLFNDYDIKMVIDSDFESFDQIL